MAESIRSWDLSILNFIQEHWKTPFGDAVMPVVTKLGDAGIIWIIIAVILLFIKKYRRAGAGMIVAMLLGLLFGNAILKNLIARDRPFAFNEAVTLLIDRPTDFSFPSGHTLSSFAAATVLLCNNKRLGIPALALACLIAFSRMYLYVHYPTDILCGILLGVALAFFAVWIVNRLFRYWEKRTLKKPSSPMLL